MFDFLRISEAPTKRGTVEIYPTFLIKASQDLMIRGSDFYAVWDEENHMWSTDEDRLIDLIDGELAKYATDNASRLQNSSVRVMYLRNGDTKMIDKWHYYCKNQMRNRFHSLDEKIIFANTAVDKKDYASKRVSYSLEKGSIQSWNELIGTLYEEEERKKIEWAIGSIISGESKNLQKFIVMYGSAGTGKSTVLNIIQELFDGYYSVFDAKALGQSTNSFALEPFKTNPLVAIQHDGDLSRIEDNTRLNSVVSHEEMTVNEKFKSAYSARFNCFLFMGTNKPVKITDAKSGILRRLIDVSPSGNKVSQRRYKELTNQIKFELGAIAWHCKEVYLSDPNAYDAYVPTSMMDSTNDFYNFIMDSEAFDIFKDQDKTSLKQAYELYNRYCEEARVAYPLTRRIFKSELSNYFDEFCDRGKGPDANIRSMYYGFNLDKFTYKPKVDTEKPWLSFAPISSVFDTVCSDCPAQYATETEKPSTAWASVSTTLQDLDTHKLHYVRVPKNHIVIDFDIPDEEGHKSFEKNFEAASKWPSTYAELSKSEAGIHLHYIYSGDPEELSRLYDDHIEVKVFTGKSSLRRKLTKCNNLPIRSLAGGLPLKEVKGDKMVDVHTIKDQKHLEALIRKALNREINGGNTKPSIDYISMILDKAYKYGMHYDVTVMRPSIIAFASGSTHNAQYCLKEVNKMHFKSEEPSEQLTANEKPIAFYDVEVFPNLFLINYKQQGEDHKVIRMINPNAQDVEGLITSYRLVGFNCRRYDNHILYARMMGYNNEQLFTLSQRIVNGSANCMFAEAYNISYTDVLDFSSKKQSLKKFEIELGIHHQELGLPWDKPVPEEMWTKVAEYCDNDVIATEATFNSRRGDFIARQILADVADGTPNDTTNTLTTKIIFGKNRHPQDQFAYRNLGEPCYKSYGADKLWFIQDRLFKDNKKAKEAISKGDIPDVFDEHSCLPWFPGYKFDHGVSTYKGYEVGEGGFVWAAPGMYGRAITFDVASMHPSSIIAECLFGPEYTARFEEILQARIAIKHKEFDKAKNMLDGKLTKYLTNPDDAKALAQALKIAINSVYGLTAAKFENPFRDNRNIDNIVAKRGALFMINLKEEVEKRGGTVIHIKTDSIKVLDPEPELQKFIISYGKSYGYNFEIEHIFEKICLVNDAVYIAKLDEDDPEEPGEWTATGTQFAVPYVFKTLFTHDPIEFGDLCETKSVTSALYLDINEGKEAELEELEGLYKELAHYEKFKEGAGMEVTRRKIKALEESAHDYRFIGKVGLFCPIKPGCGGGILVREAKDKDGNIKYASATGAKDYRWLESEVVRQLHKEDSIDKSYYQKLVDGAVNAISQYGDIEWFTA